MAVNAIKGTHPLTVIAFIVILSLGVAAILFGVLSSTGLVKNEYAEFGGAAAGFFATLWLLKRWYQTMAPQVEQARALEVENANLKENLRQMRVPPFELPPSFTPFIDHEHSMLLCYPQAWRQQPVMLQLRAFREDPLNVQPGDEFPGNFNVAIGTPGQQSYSVAEISMMANDLDLTKEELEEQMGIEISEKTASLQVPLTTVLGLMGVHGQTRAEQIYELNRQFVESMFGEENVRHDTEIVDGRESLLLESSLERAGHDTLVQFINVTYIPDTDLIFTFTFTDNMSDRATIDLLRKQVLATVKFWALEGAAA